MIQPEDLDGFKDFKSAGGLMTASNLTQGQALQASSSASSAAFSGLVDSELDYEADGIAALPSAIMVLAGEQGAASAALDNWNAYLLEATKQDDLMTVSLGVEVKRLVNDEPNDIPAPSMLPITSKDELGELELAVNQLRSLEGEVALLMTEINALLEPIPAPPADPPAPALPPPPLPQDKIDEALAMALNLESQQGEVQRKASVIEVMTSDAISERADALDYFQLAVQFTIGKGQVVTPSIQDAAKEIFPT